MGVLITQLSSQAAPVLTVLAAEGAVPPLVVLVGEHFEHEGGARQEEQQHGLEAVRRHEDVCVVQVVHQGARRPTGLVHQHLMQANEAVSRVGYKIKNQERQYLNIPIDVSQLGSDRVDGFILVSQFSVVFVEIEW